MAGGKSAQAKRREYARYFKGGHAADQAGRRTVVPANVERFGGDGSPCFMCGVRADVACRHRSDSEERRAVGEVGLRLIEGVIANG